METISLKEVIKWTGGQPINIKNEMFFDSVNTDSRKDCSGALFIALKGKNFDGHSFVFDAIKSGARAAVVERPLEGEFPQILVTDTLKALGDIAKNYRMKFSCPVIGITGSDGKTTTKEMCSQILSSRFNVCKNQGNFNNEIGLPLSIFSITSQTQTGVFELGMNGYGQLKYLSSILQPDIAIITSIGYAHLGFFKSRTDLARTKSEILEHIRFDGLVLVNNDSNFIQFFSGKTCFPPVKIGLKKGSDFRGIIIEYNRDGFAFQIEKWEKVRFRICSWNGALLYPSLFSIFVADYFGIPRNLISKIIYDFVLVEGRGRIKKIDDIFIFDESYNSNPGSMKMALHYFSKQKAQRKIVVIGEMAELGRWSKFYHSQIAQIVKKMNFDGVFTTGDAAKIVSDICGEKGKHFESVDELAEYVKRFVKKNDAILVKGSRINKLEKVIQKLENKMEN